MGRKPALSNMPPVDALARVVLDILTTDPIDLFDNKGAQIPAKKIPKGVRSLIDNVEFHQTAEMWDGDKKIEVGFIRKYKLAPAQLRALKEAVKKLEGRLGNVQPEAAVKEPTDVLDRLRSLLTQNPEVLRSLIKDAGK